MFLCKICWTPMVGVMSFSKDNHEKFYRCPKCYEETRHSKIKEDDLDFGEVLNKTIHRGGNRYDN